MYTCANNAQLLLTCSFFFAHLQIQRVVRGFVGRRSFLRAVQAYRARFVRTVRCNLKYRVNPRFKIPQLGMRPGDVFVILRNHGGWFYVRSSGGEEGYIPPGYCDTPVEVPKPRGFSNA